MRKEKQERVGENEEIRNELIPKQKSRGRLQIKMKKILK